MDELIKVHYKPIHVVSKQQWQLLARGTKETKQRDSQDCGLKGLRRVDERSRPLASGVDHCCAWNGGGGVEYLWRCGGRGNCGREVRYERRI